MTMHIGHFAFRSSDLEASAAFMRRALGLRTSAESAGQVFLSASGKHHELQVVSGELTGLDHVGLELESETELEAATDRAVAAGGRVLDSAPSEPGIGTSVRIVAAGGIVYELYVSMERRPLDVAGLIEPGVRRLGHLTFLAETYDEIREFWLEGLGFRISDELDGMTWARCDPDHHGLAIFRVPHGTVLHHHAWEVQDLAAMGRLFDAWAVEGLRLVWGPVRHGPGSNLAAYVQTPDGGVIEIYADMLRINDESGYRPVDWGSVEGSTNLWGPAAPAELFEMGLPVLSDPDRLGAEPVTSLNESSS
jgi:catechol 2,3-dioxygenase